MDEVRRHGRTILISSTEGRFPFWLSDDLCSKSSTWRWHRLAETSCHHPPPLIPLVNHPSYWSRSTLLHFWYCNGIELTVWSITWACLRNITHLFYLFISVMRIIRLCTCPCSIRIFSGLYLIRTEISVFLFTFKPHILKTNITWILLTSVLRFFFFPWKFCICEYFRTILSRFKKKIFSLNVLVIILLFLLHLGN